jgi:hypothetical protein
MQLLIKNVESEVTTTDWKIIAVLLNLRKFSSKFLTLSTLQIEKTKKKINCFSDQIILDRLWPVIVSSRPWKIEIKSI